MSGIQRDALGRVADSADAAALARKRWDRPRPVPVDPRARTLPSGSKLEQRYMAKADELGLTFDGISRAAHRRLAKRLSDDDTARRIHRMLEPRPVALDADDDLRLAHFAAEAARWRSRALRDRGIALAHDKLADEAEQDLANLLFRLGLSS